MTDIHQHKILILDFGSQYTQLIARRVREIGVYSEIHPYTMSNEEIQQFNADGIILSGGPETVTSQATPRVPDSVFELGIPVLGICYGMQAMAHQLGGGVDSSSKREFGHASLVLSGHSDLFKDIEDKVDEQGLSHLNVWMSHGDKVTTLPAGFEVIANTDNAPIAAKA